VIQDRDHLVDRRHDESASKGADKTIFQIGDVSFEHAISLGNVYAAASAMMLQLHLDRPSNAPNSENRKKKVLIWGASSSFGAYATYLATQAGYPVVGVASARNESLVKSFGAIDFVDRVSPNVVQDLISKGPFETVLAAADTADDQVILGTVLAAQGGGTFLSTMGVRPGVTLPPGVTGFFAQFLDDYLDPKNQEFTQWLWWDYMEKGMESGELKPFPVGILGGLNKVQEAWNLVQEGKVSGKRLVIDPSLD
jgi:NADPH:quinone reductase-like Zn-dependent oxidoreductase